MVSPIILSFLFLLVTYSSSLPISAMRIMISLLLAMNFVMRSGVRDPWLNAARSYSCSQISWMWPPSL